jgi:hypothetical protein
VPPEQESEELDYGVVARLNPKTHELENLEILFFSSRVANGESVQLPVIAEFRLPKGWISMRRPLARDELN